MSEKIPVRVLDAIASEPWAITDAGMDKILAIATREVEDLDIAALEAKIGKPLDNANDAYVRDGVGVISATGPIFRYANLFTRVSGATSIQTLATDFTATIENPEVRAVVQTINSPGGMVDGIAEYGRLVRALSAKTGKPVVSYFGGTAASAAYWFGVASGEVVASETTLIGSLGTIMGGTLPAKPKEGAERPFEFVYSRSPKKRVDVESPEGQAQVQAWVDALGDIFVANVAEWRGVSEEKVLADFGQGDLLIAAKALEVGMIDRISTLEEVIAELSAKTRTGIYVSPRFAASTNNKKENSMDPKEIRASLGLPETATDAEVTAKLAEMKSANAAMQAQIAEQAKSIETEARSRIAQFKAPLLAKNDLRFNAQSVGIYATILMVAKSAAAGLATAKAGDKEITLDVRSLGSFVIEQVTALTAATPKFTPDGEQLEQPADKPKATSGVTAADFKVAATNPEAAKRIAAAVAERKKTDPKFTANDLRRELTAK
jgi:ClpP class serine protease